MTADARPTSRFSLFLPFYLLTLLISTGVRTALLLRQFHDIGFAPLTLVSIYASGIFYDTLFFVYCATPFVLLLLLLPERFYHRRGFALCVDSATFLFAYLWFFIAAAEWFFWEEFATRFNFIAIDYLIYRREVSSNIYQSYPLVTILLTLAVLAGATLLLLRKTVQRRLQAQEPWRRRLRWAVPMLLLPLAGALFVGQDQHQISANSYANELAANGPYQFVAAFRNNTLDYRHFYRLGNDGELSQLLTTLLREPDARFTGTGLFDPTRQIQPPGTEEHLNVILVTVESLSADFLGTFGNTKGLTPFLDQLAKESLTFTNLYATGTRTVRGLEAINLSLPPTPGQAMIKRPDNAKVFSLGHVFDQHGYDSAFFYGGHGYFDNMNAFFSGNGYRVVDRTDLAAKEITFENAWGVADGDLYNRVIREASSEHAAGKPFFFEIMTTSNHRPFTFPENSAGIVSGSGRSGAVRYTDFALSEFITAARQQPWFDNTVFVIIADHCASSAGKDALPLAQYHIPLIIYAPRHIAPAMIASVASQIDLAPTLLGLLHFSYSSQFFGRDILLEGGPGRALVSTYQRLGLYRNNQLAYLSPKQALTVVDDPLGKEIIEPDAKAQQQPIVHELMAYYQGADWVLTHRINRWEGPPLVSHK
jgi:phosphoglycerol transferase MdoB-like AlkP superfamily enzyme